MSAPRRALAFLLVLSAFLGAAVASAGAAWEAPMLVSKGSTEQADEANESVISGDGRYVAFQGSIGGLTGIFRRDLATGDLVPVIAGSEYEPETLAQSSGPSISADGRYVSFTTPAQIETSQDPQPGSSDVYVADMATSPPTYEIASALDGCDPKVAATPCGLTYEEGGGSMAAPRGALSADGREVAFVAEGGSDFEALGTPAHQVLVRNLDTDRTTLVSTERDPVSGAMTGRPVEGGAIMAGGGASLSADGSTVAWTGMNPDRQVETFPAEETAAATYYEPLWRRIGDGPGAPTQRIVGGPSGSFSHLEVEHCTGTNLGGWLSRPGIDSIPQLSADGYTVALIGQPDVYSDVYLVDMHEGLTRGQAVRRLTRALPVQNQGNVCGSLAELGNLSGSADVQDLGISPAGNEVAFTTVRQLFPVSPPNLIDSPPASLGLTELFVLDLGSETIERVTGGPEGSPSSRPHVEPGSLGAASPSFSENGQLLAFSSEASNLVVGDGNQADDVFVAEDVVASSGPGQVSISPAPANSLPRPKWQLILSARSMPDGTVRLVVVVPGSGRVRAQFAAVVSPRGKVKKLGLRQGKARGAGPVPLELKLPRRLTHLAHTKEGLYANARVAFRGPGGRPLHGNLVIRFHAHRPAPKKGKKK